MSQQAYLNLPPGDKVEQNYSMAHPALGVLAVAILLALVIGLVTWRQRPQPGTTALAVGMFGLAWLLTSMLILNSAQSLIDAPDIAFAFSRIKWLGTNLMVLGWFFFALAYTGRGEYINRRVVLATGFIPALSGVVVLANDRFIEILLSAVGLSVSLGQFDPWTAWMGFDIAYIYTMVAAGSVLILGLIVANRLPHPTQAGFWVLAVSLPWGINFTYLTGILPPIGQPELAIDPTPLAFLLSGTVGLVAIIRYDSFETAPVARTHVVDELSAGFLVYDDACRIVDFNDWFGSAFDLPQSAIGKDIRAVLGDIITESDTDDFDAAAVADSLHGRGQAIDIDDEERYVSIEVTSLERPQGLPIGYSVLVYDVTTEKQYQQALERSNERISFERDLKEGIRDTLINVSSQSEIEQAFCDSIAGDEYPLVAISEKEPAGIRIRTVSGGLSVFDGRFESECWDLEPAATALATGNLVIISNLEDFDDPTAELAREHGVNSAIAIPVRHQGITYGVLTVYGDGQADFEMNRRLLEEFAESIAFAIHAAQQRESLRTDRPMELTVDVGGEATALGALAAADRDQAIEATEVDPKGGTATQFLTVEAEVESVSSILASHTRVESVESVDESNDKLAIRVQGPTIAGTVSNLGGAIESIRLKDGRVQVVAEFSRRADINQVMNRLRDEFEAVRLVSRVYSEETETGRRVLADLDLTEKQVEALRAAYFSGFFDRPQIATADEVADTLDISRTTFLSHVRAAERTIFEHVLDGR